MGLTAVRLDPEVTHEPAIGKLSWEIARSKQLTYALPIGWAADHLSTLP
jgi:hypothetical protein